MDLQNSPEGVPFVRRLDYGTDASMVPGELSVLSYNILSQAYIGTHRGHCDERFLEWSYRQKLIIQELQQYSPDLVGLQEVTQSAFASDLQPRLRDLGYDGAYERKTGEQHDLDGCAIFFKNDRCRSFVRERERITMALTCVGCLCLL